MNGGYFMSLIVICPRRFLDSRGWFSETYNEARFASHGLPSSFCQDNQSYSQPAGTLRGLHFQAPPHAQAKLVRCLRGRIFDVAVDIRHDSPTFGKWAGLELSADNGKQLFIPTGFAHGFVTLEADCEISYKVSDYYAPDCDGGIAWDDPTINVHWPIEKLAPVLSDKDACLPKLKDIDVHFPYDGRPLDGLIEITP